MEGETTTTTTTEAKPAEPVQPSGADPGEKAVSAPPASDDMYFKEHRVDVEFKPLFDAESVSDAQLMGEDLPGDKTAAQEPKETTPDSNQKPDQDKAQISGEEKKTDGIKPEAKAEVPAKEPESKATEKDSQITGLNTALHRERQTVRQLRAENQRLATELRTKAAPELDAEAQQFKEFKVLSDEDYDNLLLEDPEEANRYLYKFNRYQAYQSKIEKQSAAKSEAESLQNALIRESALEIEKMLPGVNSDQQNEEVWALAEFAKGHGIGGDVLEAITNPSTRIITAQGQEYVLGPGAVDVVKMLISMKSFEANKASELTKQIEERLTKEVINKIKSNNPSASFRSLDLAAGSSEKEVGNTNFKKVSESDFSRMSEAEQAAYLGG